jgi:hypothetical protein
LASPDQLCWLDHHLAGRISASQTLPTGAAMVAFSTTSNPAADLSVTSARAPPASRAAPSAPLSTTPISIFMTEFP